jgi:hypothetical protein
VTIEVRGISGDRRFRAHVVRALEETLGRLGVVPVSAHVAFADENGPKGGIAVRCLLEVRVPRRPPIDARHLAESARLAFDGALTKLDRQVARDRGRRRQQSRRPKKYYVARRALEGGPGLSRTA